MEIKKRHNLKNWNLKQKDNFTTILVFICKISCIFFFMWSLRFFYTRVFKTGRIMVYRRSVRPFHMLRSNLRTPWPIYFKFHRVIGIDGLTVCILYGDIPELWDFIHQIVRDFKAIFLMSRCKLRTPLPIHFKLRIVIGIDSLMVCILFCEISIFHSRVMGLYSSNCRRIFVCHAVNWEPLGQFTSNIAQLL
jgi:glycosyltransferase involved in cell wall biosynthesis